MRTKLVIGVVSLALMSAACGAPAALATDEPCGDCPPPPPPPVTEPVDGGDGQIPDGGNTGSPGDGGRKGQDGDRHGQDGGRHGRAEGRPDLTALTRGPVATRRVAQVQTEYVDGISLIDGIPSRR